MAILRRYKFSILIVLAIIYLSLILNPEDYDVQKNRSVIEGCSHVMMYCAFSFILWFEYMPLYGTSPLRHSFRKFKTWIICLFFPFLFGALMEIGQKYLTTYRGFEAADIVNNLIGCIFASLSALMFSIILRKRV